MDPISLVVITDRGGGRWRWGEAATCRRHKFKTHMLQVWWTCERGASVSRQRDRSCCYESRRQLLTAHLQHSSTLAQELQGIPKPQTLPASQAGFPHDTRPRNKTPCGLLFLFFFVLFFHFWLDHSTTRRAGISENRSFWQKNSWKRAKPLCFSIESKPCSVTAASRFRVIY